MNGARNQGNNNNNNGRAGPGMGPGAGRGRAPPLHAAGGRPPASGSSVPGGRPPAGAGPAFSPQAPFRQAVAPAAALAAGMAPGLSRDQKVKMLWGAKKEAAVGAVVPSVAAADADGDVADALFGHNRWDVAEFEK